MQQLATTAQKPLMTTDLALIQNWGMIAKATAREILMRTVFVMIWKSLAVPSKAIATTTQLPLNWMRACAKFHHSALAATTRLLVTSIQTYFQRQTSTMVLVPTQRKALTAVEIAWI